MFEIICIFVYVLFSFGVGVKIANGKSIQKYEILNTPFWKFVTVLVFAIIWPVFIGARIGDKLDD